MREKIDFNIDYSKLKIFEVYNEKDLKYPLLLSIPHSGTIFPDGFLQQINVSEKVLKGNEDLFVDELLAPAISQGICAIKMNVSRVFVDVNRDQIEIDREMFYDYPEEENLIRSTRCRYGIGVIHRIDSTGHEIYDAPISYYQTLERIDKIYEKYHQKLQKLADEIINKFGYCLLLDAHSMPSKICTIIDENRKIDFCLGDLFEQSCPQNMSSILAKNLQNNGYQVSTNIPYSGAYITLNYCQPRKKLYTLQLEVNRSIYSDENTLQKLACFNDIAKFISDGVVSLATKI